MQNSILDFPNYIEIKCLRFVKPKQNNLNIPLSGAYNDIQIQENSSLFPLQKKFKIFDISPSTFPGTENMFILSHRFGKILLMETFEALVIFYNKSEKEIKLKNFKITIINEPSKENGATKPLNYQVPINEEITIGSHKFYAKLITLIIDTNAKYTIVINMHCISTIYNDIFIRESQSKTPKTITEKYIIENGIVHRFVSKNLTFETLLPFKIKAKFNNYQMEKCQIEINILNHSTMRLLINSIVLIPIKNKNVEIKPLQAEKNKNLIIENKEEIKVLFEVDNHEIYLQTTGYNTIITWVNMFDSKPKKFQSFLKNELPIFNDIFIISIVEKPESEIILNRNFKIVFQLKNKTNALVKFEISPVKYYINDKEGDIMNVREVEVIDIVEKIVEFKDITFFDLICKCDILGNVSLPCMRFRNLQTQKDYEFDKLLYFDCIDEIK